MLIPSYKKQIKNTIFYEREEYINIFQKELKSSKENDIKLLMFHGIGGIGKTTLLNQLYNHQTENNIKVFINLEEYNIPVMFYSKLIIELNSQNIKLLNLKIAYSIYWSKLNPNLSIKENEMFKGEWEFLLPIIDGVGFGVGSIFKALCSNQDGIKNKILNTHKKELEELEEMSAKEIETLLPKFLNYDLVNNMKGRTETIIFFFDTHEFLLENNKKESNKLKCDVFLRDMIISTSEIKSLFVMTGRERLIWEKDNLEWNKVIKHIEVNSLSKETAKLFLKENGVTNEKIIDNIVNYTDCVPFYLNIELNNYLKLENPTEQDFDGNKTKKDILNRFITYADNNELQLLKVLSYTKKFNIDLFEKIIKEFNIPISILMFEDFVSNSYVKIINNDMYSLHNLMKVSIKNSIENKMLQNKINEFLFKYYENDILEQIEYAFELFDINGVSDYLEEKIKQNNLNLNYYLILSLYKKFLDKYEQNFIDLNQKEIKELKDNNKLKSYMLNYVSLGVLYLKFKDINSFNELNHSIDERNLTMECKNLKNYMFLKYIYSNTVKDFNKTISFFKKINLNLLPKEFSIDLKIEMANLYRQKKYLKESKELFEQISKIINYDEIICSNNLLNYHLKYGYLNKDLKDYEKALFHMNESLKYCYNDENKAKIKMGLSLLYSEISDKENLSINLIESINLYNKIFGFLNHKTLICYKIAKNNNIQINDVYYDVYNLLDDNFINNYDKLKNIFETTTDVLLINNLLKFVFKNLVKNGIYIEVEELINTVINKLSKEDIVDLKYNTYLYYKNLNYNKALEVMEEIFSLENSLNNLKIISKIYCDLNETEKFKEKYSEYINNLNDKEKLEIYKISNLEEDLFNIISLTPKTKVSLNYLLGMSRKYLLNNIDRIEEIFDIKELDIVYSYILEDCEKNRNKELIEKFLIKQVRIREKYNLENLAKGYGFLSKFYLNNNMFNESLFYTKKELEVLIKENKTEKIEKVKNIIKKIESFISKS